MGEGFSALGREEGKRYFRIGLSVEKDPVAHSTLELRSFFRQFLPGAAPQEYYQFLRGEINRECLFSKYPIQSALAREEAWCAALGSGKEFDDELDRRISKAVSDHDRWVLIGGPPCQAYSVIGRARKNGIRDYNPEKDERNYLYIEYLRILARHRPAVFVMENVKGILSSQVNGSRIFDRIQSDLENPHILFPQYSKYGKCCYKIFSLVKPPIIDNPDFKHGYSPKDFVIESEKYGIPQARHRVILLGIRDDLSKALPGNLEQERSIPTQKILNGLPKLRSGLSKEQDNGNRWRERISEALEQRWLKGARKIAGQEVYEELISTIGNLRLPREDRGTEFFRCNPTVKKSLVWWYIDSELGGVCNHSTRSHISKDIHRYLYATCYAKVHGRSPKLSNFPKDLLPDHRNAESGHFDDRFRVQINGRPSTTITCHISKDGHYYIHPDPCQCRSLTVREAARLQTFPDNYFFAGNRTQQYTQVGNAVPPLLAYKIAGIIKDFLESI